MQEASKPSDDVAVPFRMGNVRLTKAAIHATNRSWYQEASVSHDSTSLRLRAAELIIGAERISSVYCPGPPPM